MKLAKAVTLSFSLLAFAGASAYAADAEKEKSASSSSQSTQSQQSQPSQQSEQQTQGSAGAGASASGKSAQSEQKEAVKAESESRTSAAGGGSAADSKKMQGGSTAAGASTSSGSEQSQPKDESKAQSETQSPAAGGSSSAAGSTQQQGQMGTKQLIGQKVTDTQGESLGEIKDVVVDLEGGKVHAAVLEFGGFLGLGEKQYAFPISDLKPGKTKDQLTINVDKQKLKNAEGFAKGQWPQMDDEYWGRVGGQASGGAGKAQDKTLVRASKLQGQDVQDQKGQEVGKIQDVMVDLNSGRLGEIVLDVKDAGQAKVQAKSLTRGTGDKIVLDMSADEVKSRATKSRPQARSDEPRRPASAGSSSAGQTGSTEKK